MTVFHARLEVNNTTPVPVTSTVDSSTAITVQVQNLGAGVAYLGGAGVSSTSYGVRIVSGATVTVESLPAKDELYVIHQDALSHIAVLIVSR
jgi:hypothetical protein